MEMEGDTVNCGNAIFWWRGSIRVAGKGGMLCVKRPRFERRISVGEGISRALS